MPPGSPAQTGDAGWGAAQPQRRPEAAYEQTGAMAAQQYEEPSGRQRNSGPQRPQQPGPQQPGPQGPGPYQQGPQETAMTQRHPAASEPAPTQRQPRARSRQDGGGRRDGGRQDAGRQDTRVVGSQETIVSDAPPRRGRRGGAGAPPDPPGPPKKTRGGWRRFVPSWKIVVAGFVVLAAGLFGMVMVAYSLTPLPDEDSAQAAAVAQQSIIYYNDGKTEIARLGTKRTIVRYDQLSDYLKDATVAIENDTFWTDSGISISGMFRSVWMTATGQQLQGASTITQQMARNYYDGLSRDVSVTRKVKEIFVAVKLDQRLTKEDILRNYLNTVNFGLAYGAEAAAREYFGKKATAKNLTPSQAAYLAARIQQPNWKPDAPELKYRWKTVIDYMAKQWPQKYGDLPAKAEFPKTAKRSQSQDLGDLKGYMVKEVMAELADRNVTDEMVRSEGYKIVSTFDKKLMEDAKKAVHTHMDQMSSEFHTGLAAVDPKTGRVIAFYGGDDYDKDQFNEPFDAEKQAASAFKPYVLAAWLQAGYSLQSYVPGNKTVPEKIPGQAKTGFNNSHNEDPAIDVIRATAQSVNTAYVSMAFKLPNQLEDVNDLVKLAGFNAERMDEDVRDHQFQFSIGSALVSPVEQAAGYSIFANGGKYTRYHVIQKVTKDGQVVLPELRNVKKVIDPDVAADATIAMQEVLKSGTARGQGLGARPAAGKTGTNNDEKEAWFVGYTPQLSVAVGMYREVCYTKTGRVVPPRNSACPATPGGKASKKYGPHNPYSTAREASLGFEGAGPPTRVWRTFMMLAHEGKEIEQFPARADVGIAENIVTKPTPTPTPTDPFGDPTGDPDCGLLGCDDIGEDVTSDPDVDQGIPDSEDHGIMGGGTAPQPGSSGPTPVPSRPEDR
ncbi:penicillin-binding protein [Nonomuraea sp. NN258]|uniref:transglycosylase domain-containing protein n=1 Tax=Nonomuraea antri TaxID=2730852 RepID=UPI001568DA9A|nr:transglycosylase domain-containing protein [Nonomuraea antri]NRQ32708.1 penicillin-binding protein [Nonomuraea antri]